jgi:hypothetical protein
MPRTSFISNFKRLPLAFLLALVTILGIERYVATRVTPNYFNHEVDHLLRLLDVRRFKADYLLIGDSVALQLYRQFQKDPRFDDLAANQAIETTGHYFLVRRYLEKNPPPKAVIFTGLPFHFRDLRQVYTENFVLRTFTHIQEIMDIFQARLDPAMAAKMIAYKTSPSYKFRLKLQQDLVNFSNSDVYSGVDVAVKPAKLGSFSVLSVLSEGLPRETTGMAHFRELLAYLEGKGIDIYYIPAPVPVQDRNKHHAHVREELISSILPQLKDEYANFHYYSELVEFDQKWFVDGVHFTPEGLFLGEEYLRKRVEAIVGKTQTVSLAK